MEHVFDINQLLSEINRVTKKEGSLLITLPFCVNEHEIPYDFARYSYYGIKHLLEIHGYKIINYTKTSNNVGAIFQLIAAYISECFLPNNSDGGGAGCARGLARCGGAGGGRAAGWRRTGGLGLPQRSFQIPMVYFIFIYVKGQTKF